MVKLRAAAMAAVTAMIAVPDFSAKEWNAQANGEAGRVRYCIKTSTTPAGEAGTVLAFSGECPWGWLHANGQYIVRELYPELYGVLESFAAAPPPAATAVR